MLRSQKRERKLRRKTVYFKTFFYFNIFFYPSVFPEKIIIFVGRKRVEMMKHVNIKKYSIFIILFLFEKSWL